jgi:hypothetical protein
LAENPPADRSIMGGAQFTMTGDKGPPLVRSRWRFVVAGVAGIGLSVLLIISGFAEELLSDYVAALPGVIGIGLLVMGLKRSR